MASRGVRRGSCCWQGFSCLFSALVFLSACSDDSGGDNGRDPDATSHAVCGNGILDNGEECDEGTENSDVAPNACRSDCRLAWCGDKVADEGEDCDDRDMAGKDCRDLTDSTTPVDWPEARRRFTGGHLACNLDCTFDVSGCSRCGNAVAEAEEECDGTDYRNQDCASVTDRQQGVLRCREDCTFDTSGCHTCGDGMVEESEDCEPGKELEVMCRDLGWSWGEVACDPQTCRYDVSGCRSICGNGRQEGDEDCDGREMSGLRCEDFGFSGGELGCSQACRLDLSRCSKCGNGVLDTDWGEECDGTDLGDESCETLTGQTGMLRCMAECRLDLSGCVNEASCGNGMTDAGEECDGTDLAGASCETVRGGIYGSGQLSCRDDCTYDTSGCLPAAHCGNRSLEPEFGEECDGTDLGGQTCRGLGYAGGGELSCTAECTFDVNACSVGGTCGNGMAEPGENCDGTDLGGATCESLGFLGGQLRCLGNCQYDISGCDTCGNGVVDGPDEECDGVDLNGQTCEGLGYSGGRLGCQTPICRFDKRWCIAECGNGIAEPNEDCDGTDLGGATCENLGYSSGTLACRLDTCEFITDSCVTECGNGVLEPGEVCDDGNAVDWDGCTQCEYREILVASPPSTSVGCGLPRIEYLADGRFVIVWYCSDRYEASFVQRFHPDGTPEDGIWLSPNPEDSHSANVFAWPDGRLVIGRSRAAALKLNIDVRSWDLAPIWELDLDVETQYYDPVFVPLSGHRLAVYMHGYDGAGPGSIRILDDSGSQIQEWSIPTAEWHVVGDMVGDDTGLYTVFCTELGHLTLTRWTLDGTALWSVDIPTSTSRTKSARLRMGAGDTVWLLHRGQNDDVYLSQFAQDGAHLVHVLVTNDAYGYRIALDSAADERAVAVWEDSAHNVYARSFGSDGQPISGLVRVDDVVDTSERRPWVGVNPVNGRFIVAYGAHGSIYARAFAADGSPLGPPPW